MITKYLSAFTLQIIKSAVWGGYFAAVIGWLTSVVLPIKDFLVLTTGLVILDLITGVLAAKKRKEPIRSRALMRTTIKLLLYYSAILATQGIEITFAEKIPLTYITAFTIAITELKSLLENVDAGTGSRLANMIVEKLTKKK